MEDTLLCPICNNKLRNVRLYSKFLYQVGKQGEFIERTCTKGMNHTLNLYANEDTDEIEFLILSLDKTYSRFIEIDFHNQRCRIRCIKNGREEIIDIDRMLVPDFPSLTELKKKVSLFVSLS